MKTYEVYLPVIGTIKKRVQAENRDDAKKKGADMLWRLVEEQNLNVSSNVTLHEGSYTDIGAMKVIS